MSKIKTFFRLLLTNPSKLGQSFFLNTMDWRIMRIIGDKAYLRFAYRCCLGKKLNIKNPVDFCEKLQWLKLYDRNPRYTLMVDKYAVKEYVSQKIGSQYVLGTLGVWNSPEEIEFHKLPKKFVLKWNHDSGSIYICRDKGSLNIDAVLTKLKRGSYKNGYWYGREWPYKNVKPCIIAEELLEDPNNEDLIDYKFFCFNGEPKYCQVIRDRNSAETIDFYDMEWNRQPFTGLNTYAINSPKPISKPNNLALLQEMCRILSKDIAFVRIDFYVVEDRVYFGEITFYPASGFGTFTPQIWNRTLGDMINLH